MSAARHLTRLSERGAEELSTALTSIADAARSGTGMRAALVSRVEGSGYTTMALSVEGHSGLTLGQAISLEDTLCSRVVSSTGPVTLPDATAGDPRADRLGIGSYAGVPLFHMTGALYGTLAVLDPQPRDSLGAEVEFLGTLSRLATHEIGLLESLQRLIDEVRAGVADEAGCDPDPVGDLQGLAVIVAAALRRTGPHDSPRLRRTLATETNRVAHDLIDKLMRHRHLNVLPGNAEPWGTEVDQLLQLGPSLLPGNQGTRIRVQAQSTTVADIPRRHLERILVNLVYQAWRSSPPPSPITLISRARAAMVEIVVEDRGPAVLPEDVPGMFDQAGRGLLGLSVVNELVNQAGGSLLYQRHQDVNRVIVRLPAAGAPRLVAPEGEQCGTAGAE